MKEKIEQKIIETLDFYDKMKEKHYVTIDPKKEFAKAVTEHILNIVNNK